MRTGARTVRSASDLLLAKLLAFGRRLRASGLGITTGRVLDATRALALVPLENREDLRIAMRTNLASSREEEQTFDRLFETFWDERQKSSSRIEIEAEPASAEQLSSPPSASDAGHREGERYGRAEVDEPRDLRKEWPGGSREFDRAVEELRRSLATRPSRRRRPSRRGARIDVRRSLRANVRHGLDIVNLVRSSRKIRKTRLVLACDVSGSMEHATPFLLRLMVAVQHRLGGSRTAVFSTRLTDVTRALRRRGIEATLDRVAALARHWSGGTDIGAALATLNRTILASGSPRSTVCLVVSDGYDRGDPARVAREMKRVASRCRTTVWVNPLLGSEGYEPLARGMKAALPFVDHFLPAHDVASLRRLAIELRSA